MLVLGIESTCDETAIAIVLDGKEILCNLISSQADLLALYGGVFPEQASRRHIEVILPLIEQAFQQTGLKHSDIDLIACAYGPGLIGPLLIGLNVAKGLAMGWDIPFIGVNHVEAHLYAALMAQQQEIFPALGVVISGGHTLLLKMEGARKYELIGSTVDDAIGEAFDKVARLLELGYPGGPEIERLAHSGNKKRYPFRSGTVKGRPWDFSFSGLKTSVLYAVKGVGSNRHSPILLKDEDRADVAASFQYAAFSHLIDKTVAAAEAFGCKAIYLGGGVSNSRTLRQLFKEKMQELKSDKPLFWPTFELSQDNAAMIAGLGFIQYKEKGTGDPLSLMPRCRIPIGLEP